MSLVLDTTAGPRDVSHAAPGRWLLRWWFPKAATPHCALQARALFGSWAALAGQGLDVVGLSYDDTATLTAWAGDLGLPYPLATAGLAQAEQLSAARPASDPWREALPRRVFDIVDEHGDRVAFDVVTDAEEFLEQVVSVLHTLRELEATP